MYNVFEQIDMHVQNIHLHTHMFISVHVCKMCVASN